jgi:predicted 2-oxoglutarate/Fe(II)-dependent dioxygenase YbiX
MSHAVVAGTFVSRDLCTQIVAEIERDGCWQWGEINYGGRSHVDLEFRRTQWCAVPPACEALVAGRLLAIGRALATAFGPIRSFEGPNLLRYRAGDFFRPHADVNPRERVDRRSATITVFLNDRGFDGGVLRLYERRGGRPLEIAPRAGRFVAFDPEIVHEVTPIVGGNRYALVAWLH